MIRKKRKTWEHSSYLSPGKYEVCMGMVVILTCRLISVDTERWRRMVHLLHRGEASHALKKSFFLLFFSLFVNCKTERNPNAEKAVDFDRGGFWYFSCFRLEVRQSSDACVDRCVFIQEQICLRTPTNIFTSTDKYTLHGPTNISASSDKYTSR